ncbi:HEAT repeat domain-containing protein [Desulfogranum japonicum]|uniref:HEAT repeat domain-containing protein n=1 Tax=Desulfogranum japonicum TaxID=231447 RepID=UPI000409042C|nr:HEAT repeat domain-containing protein [Desulfogranum japonicum]
MQSTDREVRLSAAYILGDRGGAAVGPLITALDDPDKGVQYASMWSLKKIGNGEATKSLKSMIPMLKKDIQNPDTEFQKTAKEILQMIE